MIRFSIALLLFATVSFAADSQASTGTPDLTTMDLEQLLDVTVISASLHRQGISDAPASVSVITAVDIRRYGYRTLAEALNSVPGIYISGDRAYSYLGSRGLSTPGDVGTRYLLMVNGHSISQPVFDLSGVLEQEFGIEMSLIKQIEIVNGPASALYGSNAVLCTINVVTKGALEMEGIQVETSVGTQGEKKEHIAAAGAWKEASGILSASVFNFSGEHSIYIPERDTPENNSGRAIDVDGQRGFHLFANVTWREWNFVFMEGQRNKIVPVAWEETQFNDRGTRVLDTHGFGEATYTHTWKKSEVEWRLSYDWYDYTGQYRYQREDQQIVDNRETDGAKWLGSKLVYRAQAGKWGTSTIGMDTRIDFQTMFSTYDVYPEKINYVYIDKPDRRFGFFAQHEVDLGRRWKAVLGARLDTSAYRRNSASPRLALIWEPWSRTKLKLLYGRSFRNPTPFEMFFEDDRYFISNPTLRPEIADTFELVAERHFRREWKASIDLFSVRMRDTITQLTDETGFGQFHNESKERMIGGTGEVAGQPFSWLEMDASLTIQKATVIGTGNPLANSPREVAKVRASVPLIDHRWRLSGAAYWVGQRDTLAGTSVSGALKSDLTLTRTGLRGGLEIQSGVRNLFDKRSFDPAGLDPQVPALPQTGRTVFVTALWRKAN